jgi:hypothetical protein
MVNGASYSMLHSCSLVEWVLRGSRLSLTCKSVENYGVWDSKSSFVVAPRTRLN